MAQHFAKLSHGGKIGAGEVQSEQRRPIESIPTGEKRVFDASIREDEMRRKVQALSDGPDTAPQFTFYESLPKEPLPITAPGTEARETSKGKPSTKVGMTSPGIPAVPEQGARESTPVVYYVQVASFQEEGRARRLAQQLRERGFQADVVSKIIIDRGIWHRVLMGPFDSRKLADEKAKAIAEADNLRPFVRPERRDHRR
jgi:cell division septation protein DedD